MSMTCREAEELLGAYALEALPDDEARRMAEHLATCQEHATATAELQQTQSQLALTVDDAKPSADLRARIMSAVEAVPAAGRVVETRPAARPVPMRRMGRVSRWAPRPVQLAVAAALLIALGIGSVIGYRLNQNAQPTILNFTGDASKAPGAEARLVYFKDRQQALLAVSGLPRLSPGQIYELWLIKGAVPVDVGISASPDGKIAALVSANLTRFDVLAITIEPGEQPLPTSTPILVGKLS